MLHPTKFILFQSIALLARAIPSELPGSLESLVTEVLHEGEYHLANPGESRAEVWFFKSTESAFYSDDVVDRLIAVKPFSEQPKIIFDEFSVPQRESSGKPMLVIAFFGTDHHLFTFESPIATHFSAFTVQTKLIVVFLYNLSYNLKDISSFFAELSLFKVIYIPIHTTFYHDEMFNYVAFRNSAQVVHQRQYLLQGFSDHTIPVKQEISTCTYPSAFYSDLDSTNALWGIDVNMVRLIVRHMNRSVVINILDCNIRETECLERHIDPHVCQLNFGRWILPDAEYGIPVLPMESTVIMVPRGSPLTIYELMVAAYSWKSWLLIIVGTILGLILVQLFLKHSAVSLFLLIVCGLEDSSLNLKRTFEQLVLSGCIVFVFLLLSGYDAKITAFLPDWPYHPDISSIDELREAGVEILANQYFVPEYIYNDPRLRGLIRQSNISAADQLFKLTHQAGFITKYQVAKVILKKQHNIDRRTRRARFVLLEECLSRYLMFFYFGKRNPIKARFAELQQRVYEAGIDQPWTAFHRSFQAINQQDLVEEPPKMILFKQLWNLKSIFIFLWVSSLITFLLELIYFKHFQPKPAPIQANITLIQE